MSRILKRPMFRRGGEAMDGVMNLAQPRRKYAESNYMDIVEDLDLGDDQVKVMEAFRRIGAMGKPSKNDLIARTLITGGLRGLGTTGGGSTLGNLGKAFAGPVDEALKLKMSGDMIDSKSALSGLSMALKGKYAKEAKKTGYESQTPESQIKGDAVVIAKMIENNKLDSIYADATGVATKMYYYGKQFGDKFVRFPKLLTNKKGQVTAVDPGSLKVGDITWVPGFGLITKTLDDPDPNKALVPYTGD